MISMKILEKIKQLFLDSQYELRARKTCIPDIIEYPVPFVCQYARKEDVENIVKRKLHIRNDPFWHLSGARSSKEYARWAREICGMAVASMAIQYFKNKKIPPISLTRGAFAHNVYSIKSSEISPMRYREFSSWIIKYGLKAEVHPRLSVRGIQFALAEKKLPIVSVNPGIRDYTKTLPIQRGRHLVVITGYNIPHQTLFLNNPSGFLSTNTQENHAVSIKKFRRYYASR